MSRSKQFDKQIGQRKEIWYRQENNCGENEPHPPISKKKPWLYISSQQLVTLASTESQNAMKMSVHKFLPDKKVLREKIYLRVTSNSTGTTKFKMR